MSNLTDALQLGQSVPIDGTDVQFPPIEIYDLGLIDQARKQHLKNIAKANAKDAGLLPADIFNVTMDIDARDFTVNDMLVYAQTPKGVSSVLERSLVKAGRKDAEAQGLVRKLLPTAAVNLAVNLILKTRDAKPKDEKQQQGASDPNAPAAADTTAAESSPITTSTATTPSDGTDRPDKTLAFGD